MAEQDGLNKIKKLRHTWISYQLLGDVLLAMAIAIISGSLLYYFAKWPGWCIPVVFILVSALLIGIRRPWQILPGKICNFLNLSYPELEESSNLIIKPANSLNLLEQLQLKKVELALEHIPNQPTAFTKRAKSAVLLVILAFILSFAISKINDNSRQARKSLNEALKSNSENSPPEKILAQIEFVNVKITPPAYTGILSHTQDKFVINCEEGSEVNWMIHTNVAVKQAFLLFNGKNKINLTGLTNDKTRWKTKKIINQTGFYQVSIDGKLSDFYQIQVLKDGPPVIHIKSPKQYTHIDTGEALKVNLNATVNDDYGVSDALIYATVAKGSGEAVKFKEYKMSFNASFQQHNRQYDLQKSFDLPALNMEPGDELYFYIEARDNRMQKSKTDVYIVSIQDTAQLLSMDGLVTGSNIKPEYFRSERQIILDTERLLKERDSISQDAFKTRCNDLGTDQKLLRLRYGKFLGEEDESGKEGSDELNKVENFSNAQMIMDAYTDKHDNAEDATFLEPAIKQQLKATLTEMWKAELQLRMYKPNEALPFEYKALRLLKDLQQKSRSYVAKTGYNPPPIKIEKRLSGDLSKISQPVIQKDIKASADRFETLKKTIAVLEQLKYGSVLNSADITTLQLTKQQLSVKASAEPGNYLPAISALQRIISTTKKINVADISVIEKAIQKTLPAASTLPSISQTNADLGLSQQYYKNLNHLNR
ncbi:DUF4175 family protein [Mucilaginibacter sp.]|uniref:DUF4175 family protein n=1 Tax=Mucilaginibacter sp. TaxID=1882438 RepID=UPI00263013F2|nr:DUF4175 family protein [Mucilaginibacter sp.]MDB4918039.1 hypothetical protein [Mucilaginibacter sp.]